MARAEQSSRGAVQRVREAMIRLSEERGFACADDARDFAARAGIALTKYQYGAIFSRTRDGHWRRVGEQPSRHPANHAHVNKLWRWVRRDG
jgi:hypothetical protein